MQCLCLITSVNSLLVCAFLPGLIKELNREADDLIICDDSLVLVCHLSTILIRSIRSYQSARRHAQTPRKSRKEDGGPNIFI